jgi:pimeloyl-ACP methyl ester carboxylesterase
MTREGSVRTTDGRTLAYRDAGEPAGIPVVDNHGTPGSRLDRHPDQARLLAELGVRLITYDRPGYGGSDRRPGRRVIDAAADVAAILDELRVERFSVTGGSGGGPHALACSAVLGDRIDRVGIVVGGAPSDDPEFDFLEGMSRLNVDEFGAAAESVEAIEAYLAPFVEGARQDPDAVIDEIAAHLPESDRQVWARPAQRALARASLAESVRQGAGGWIDDDRAFMTGWGFELSQAGRPTRLWQGELDVLVPRRHCEYLAAHLPDARFELIPGAGHLLADHWGAILTWVAAGGG